MRNREVEREDKNKNSVIHAKNLLFGGLFSELDYVLSARGVTLLGPSCVWGVAFGTQHWATWSNGYQRTFKLTKPLKLNSNNHDND